MPKTLDGMLLGAAGLGLIFAVGCGPKHVNTDPTNQPKPAEAGQSAQSNSGWEIPDFKFLMEDFIPYQQVVSGTLSERIEAEKWLYQSDPSKVWEAQGVVIRRGVLNFGDGIHIGGEDNPDAPIYKKAYLSLLVRVYTIQTEHGQISAVVPYLYRHDKIKSIQDNTPPHIFNVGDSVHVKFSGQFKTDHGVEYHRFKDKLIPMMQVQTYRILSRPNQP